MPRDKVYKAKGIFPFDKSLSINFKDKKPNIKEVIKPLKRVSIAKLSPPWKVSNSITVPPKIMGRERRKEKVVASFFSIPIISIMEMVLPLRLKPGRVAKPCIIPVASALKRADFPIFVEDRKRGLGSFL